MPGMLSSPPQQQQTGAPPVPAEKHRHNHIWLVTGPAGCGKTTVAESLAHALNMPYIEGDSANVDKMRSGTPLTDADRWDWLTVLRDESMRRICQGSGGVVVTCSALKRKYRDVMRVASYYHPDVVIHFIFLVAPADVLLRRVAQRKGHYMGPEMVQSQLDILEIPDKQEQDVVTVDVSRSIDEVQKDVAVQATDVMKADLA